MERRDWATPESIEQLASSALDYISASDMSTAVFYGHSMGGLVAFELCRLLIDDRRELPLKVILGGSAAPGTLPQDTDGLISSPLAELPQYIRDRTAAGVARSRAYAPPKQRIPVSLELIRGLRDELVSVSATMAWAEYCAQTPRYHRVDGDHLFHRTRTEEFMSVLRVLIPCTTSCPGTVAAS